MPQRKRFWSWCRLPTANCRRTDLHASTALIARLARSTAIRHNKSSTLKRQLINLQMFWFRYVRCVCVCHSAFRIPLKYTRLMWCVMCIITIFVSCLSFDGFYLCASFYWLIFASSKKWQPFFLLPHRIGDLLKYTIPEWFRWKCIRQTKRKKNYDQDQSTMSANPFYVYCITFRSNHSR